MKIKPVKRAKTPNYPVLEYYINNPELLSKSIPESWIKNKYVATSLATFILLGTAKSNLFANQARIEISENYSSDSEDKIKNEIKDSVKIAPIFVHGDGLGGTGCIVVSPPVFISENEARLIIFNALEEKGIKFNTEDCPEIKFKSAPIANDCYYGSADTDVPDAEVELKMDGYNKELNLAVQYVSVGDFSKFKSNEFCFSSGRTINTKDAADIIREELIKDGKTNAVVFYDPIASINFEGDWETYYKGSNWEKYREKAVEESKKLLLAQVEDFLKWLKKEKILKKRKIIKK
ncbi:MAG: hypothetical protein GX259_06310 [Bacteroidales bacterium]|nr:hypothetical protein [Bacteroidales bacterium]